jgi:cysteine desulfurase / selenocysteine lyase
MNDTPKSFDVWRVRKHFPILSQTVYGRPLVYLDNAATAQSPQSVVDAMARFYTEERANIHRGVHRLSMLATEVYETARKKVQRFIGAEHAKECIFVRGTTEGINLVAQSWGRQNVRPGDEILISAMEHHSNIVPWQMLCEQTGAELRVVPITDEGELDMEAFGRLLSPRTRLVAVVHISNALGTINPVREIVELAHAAGALVLLDGAQAAPHVKVDVRELGCDFYTLSAHKLFGPTGTGVLYGKAELLDRMPPYQGGGDMIASVSFEKTVYNVLPYKFEAGTPHIAGGYGLGAAIDYLQELDWDAVARHEDELLRYATEAVSQVPGVRLIGTARHKASVLSFVLSDIHAHDVGTILDRGGIAIRTGHHCAQPVMKRFDVPATARASFAFYNTREEVDALVAGLHQVLEVFGS